MESLRYKLKNTYSQALIEYGDENGQEHLFLSMGKMDNDMEVLMNKIN